MFFLYGTVALPVTSKVEGAILHSHEYVPIRGMQFFILG